MIILLNHIKTNTATHIENHIKAHIETHIKAHNRRTQLLFATGIERGIHDCQVLKYQPLVTSRLMFQYPMIANGIK